MGEGGQVVLQLGELLQPVAAHQVGTGGERLAHLDEAGPQIGEGGENAPGQPLLHQPIGLLPCTASTQGQAGQLASTTTRPADQEPGPSSSQRQSALGS